MEAIKDDKLSVPSENRDPEEWKNDPKAMEWYRKRKAEAYKAWKSGNSRSKAARRKLIGYSTEDTWPFYKCLPYSPVSLRKHIDDVSKERYAFTPKRTPEKYWSMQMSPPSKKFDGVWVPPKPKVFRRLWSKEPVENAKVSCCTSDSQSQMSGAEINCDLDRFSF